MMKHEEVHFALDDGPEQDFTSSKLQISGETPTFQSNLPPSKTNLNDEILLNGNFEEKPIENEAGNTNFESIKVRPTTLAVVPWSGDNARDFFSYRDGLVTNAVVECIKNILSPDDGDCIGSWLLTEISFWDHEKERLVLLTSKCLIVVKYDFIALKVLDTRKVPIDVIDTVIIGELSYPSTSLIPSRKMSGVRAMWNQGRPLTFIKKWNPFEKEIPFTTFTSHPLLWHKEATDVERRMYNADDFTANLNNSLDKRQRNFQCTIQHKPIILENYIGLGSLIHNKNSLGFFKVRGKFSF